MDLFGAEVALSRAAASAASSCARSAYAEPDRKVTSGRRSITKKQSTITQALAMKTRSIASEKPT